MAVAMAMSTDGYVYDYVQLHMAVLSTRWLQRVMTMVIGTVYVFVFIVYDVDHQL